MTLLAELRRRNVFKVAAAYAVVGWLVIEISSTVLPQFNVPDWAPRLVTLLIAFGFPVALVLAWALEVTPEGVKVTTGQTGNKRFYIFIAVLTALGAGWFLRGHEASAPAPAPVAAAPVAAPAAADRSIAVLPFVNMSADPNQEYFSDGIAEELLNRLAQFPDLKVAARTSAFQFKGKNEDIGEIGKQLKVSHVLEGSVRKGGTTLRITAQLIDSRTGYHLWSETYDRDAADVLKVQDDIATAIANALESRLGGRTTKAAAANPAAYDDYLQGRALVARRYLDNLDKAVAAFDRAIAKDPNFSPAYSGRAFALLLRPQWGALPGDTLVQARAAADRALELDPNNAEGYMVRASVAQYSRDYAAAAVDFDHALALAPGNADVLNLIGDFDLQNGRPDRAEDYKRRAMALDPLAFVHPLNLADALGEQGRYDEALEMAERAIALGSVDYGRDRVVLLAFFLGRAGLARKATAERCDLHEKNDDNCEIDQLLLAIAEGQRGQAKVRLDRLAQRWREHPDTPNGISYSFVAFAYVEIGDIRSATEWQRLANSTGDWFPTNALVFARGGAKLPEEISRDPDWLAAWSDPQLRDVMTVYRRNLLSWRAGRH